MSLSQSIIQVWVFCVDQFDLPFTSYSLTRLSASSLEVGVSVMEFIVVSARSKSSATKYPFFDLSKKLNASLYTENK